MKKVYLITNYYLKKRSSNGKYLKYFSFWDKEKGYFRDGSFKRLNIEKDLALRCSFETIEEAKKEIKKIKRKTRKKHLRENADLTYARYILGNVRIIKFYIKEG